MMSKGDTVVPIIVAIIGIIGTSIIIPAFSGLPTQFYNKPILNIDISRETADVADITLTNTGAIPATNLSLILGPDNANTNVSFVTNIFISVAETFIIGS